MKIFLLKNSHQLEGILRAKYLSGWIIKDSKQEPHKEFLRPCFVQGPCRSLKSEGVLPKSALQIQFISVGK